MAATDSLRTPLRTLDRLVDRTPRDRDRVVDAVRAFSIVVVLVWHWSLSVTHRTPDGTLGSEPTLSWWLTRPLWVLGPAILLVPLVALFAMFELGRRRRPRAR